MSEEKKSEALEPFQKDFKLFVEAGFMAVQQSDENHARKLFYAAQSLRPEHSAPRIGLGYIALNKLQVKEAEAIFTEVLEGDPENHLAQAFLGIACLLREPKRDEGEKLMKKALKESEDPTVKKLCKVSLEWADKDLKKSPAPFFAQAKDGESEESDE